MLSSSVSTRLVLALFGGGRGIRTLEELSPLTVFKTAAFNHSAISPYIYATATVVQGGRLWRDSNRSEPKSTLLL